MISQFLPLVEHEILRKLVHRVVVLMDMPGLYLQPQTQSRLLDYFRSVVKENENFQFQLKVKTRAELDKLGDIHTETYDNIVQRLIIFYKEHKDKDKAKK